MHDPKEETRKMMEGCLRKAYGSTAQPEAMPDRMQELLDALSARTAASGAGKHSPE